MNLGKYAKTITAIVTGAIAWATIVITSAPAAISATEWLTGATYLAVALGVYATPNKP